MAVAVSEVYDGRSTKVGLYLIRHHVRRFVATTTAGEGSFAVAFTGSVPSLGDAHPEDAVALCVDVDAKPKSGEPAVWDITCKYTNDLPSDDIDDDDPLSQRPELSWGAEDFSRFVGKDRNDKPILNTAGDRYEDPVEVVDGLPVLTIKKNKASFNAATAYAYNNSTNSDVYRGADPGTLRVRITAVELWKGDAAYWATSYTFRYNPEGWQPTIMETGLYQLYLGSHIDCFVKGATPHDSEAVTHPVPLDANGEQIDPSTLGNTPSPVVHTTWDVLPELPYSALGV